MDTRATTLPSNTTNHTNQDDQQTKHQTSTTPPDRVRDVNLAPNHRLASDHNTEYEILGSLGHGTFGEVYKVRSTTGDTHDRIFALKVMRSRAAFRVQAEKEVEILSQLRIPPAELEAAEAKEVAAAGSGERLPPRSARATVRDARTLIVQLCDSFWYKDHMCIVSEQLGINLLQLMQQHGCRGFPMSLVRFFCKQLLQAINLLRSLGIVHCDLKPENILLQGNDSPSIKLVDFGSACFVNEQRAAGANFYVQSRFYRAPEIIMGLPFDLAIDLWSFGTMTAELFLGLPLFAGESEYNQLARIVAMLGPLDDELLAEAPRTARFYRDARGGGSPPDASEPPPAPSRAEKSASAPPRFRLKEESEYAAEFGLEVTRNKQYFKYGKLGELIVRHPSTKQPATPEAAKSDAERRRALTHFICGFLRYQPSRRWSPRSAIYHPFITGEPFPEDYDFESVIAERRLANEAAYAQAPSAPSDRIQSKGASQPAVMRSRGSSIPMPYVGGNPYMSYGGAIPYAVSPPGPLSIGFYGSPPCSMSPASTSYLHHAVSMSPPMDVGTAHLAHAMPSQAVGGYMYIGDANAPVADGSSIQMGCSPPDRPGAVGLPSGNNGVCIQCRTSDVTITDERDGNLYCVSCWQEYFSAGGDVPPAVREKLMYAGFGVAQASSRKMRIGVSTGGGGGAGSCGGSRQTNHGHRARSSSRGSRRTARLGTASDKMGAMSLTDSGSSESGASPVRGSPSATRAENRTSGSDSRSRSGSRSRADSDLSFADAFDS